MAKKKSETARKQSLPVRPPTDIERSLARLRIKFHGLVDFALIPAAAWFVLVTVELIAHIIISTSLLRNERLPIGARFFLFCRSLIISFLCVVAIIGLIRLLKWIHNRYFAHYKAVRWINNGLTAALTYFVLLVYSSSSGLFWQTGRFIDGQVFLFLAPHPLQVFHWVDADVSLIVIALALVITWVLPFLLLRWVKRQNEIAKRRLVSVCGWMLGVCLLGSALGEIYGNAASRQFMRTTILYAKSRSDVLGPFPYFLGDIQRHIRRDGEERLKPDNIRIIQRPILSMDRYRTVARQRPFDRHNVVILMIESVRPDQLRAYGSERDVMPNIDLWRMFLGFFPTPTRIPAIRITRR